MDSFFDCARTFFTTPSWQRTLLIIIGIDWLIGILYIQYFYYRTTKLRFLDPEVKKRSAPFVNSVETWNKFVHCLGSVFMIPRVIIFLSSSVFMFTTIRLLSIGESSFPLKGWKRVIMKFVTRISARLMLFGMSFVWISRTKEKIDYTKWFGEDYKPPKERAPIIISNHYGSTDIFTFMSTPELPGFIAAEDVSKIPLYGYGCKSLGSLFVERSSTESKEKTVNFNNHRYKQLKSALNKLEQTLKCLSYQSFLKLEPLMDSTYSISSLVPFTHSVLFNPSF